MTEETKESVFLKIDLNPKVNNAAHHTSQISESQLVVRRGQSFQLILTLSQPFNSHPLHFTAITGSYPSEKQGTASFFGLPGNVKPSALAKAAWKVELDNTSSPRTGVLTLNFTPPADAPIGEYTLSVKHRGEEKLLGLLTVLFNPWCKDDWVFMPNKDERQEYVMNEQGIIYKGSGNYISPMNWDFGQFEESMVNVCLRILDLNPKHLKDPADDVSARCNPIYVSRVISAMINCEDDSGVLEGCWGGPYLGGVSPSHWSGSHPILMQWIRRDCRPVKYGQCWVFAGVMCSVMRLLGIPCRVVTNYSSAHDNNRNLTIDVYHADYGVREKETRDSVWNFHVWVEGWMRRPDLAADGKYDGWQVLDPTPQEKSGGVYCCGPAPVKAIFEGQTDLKYDIPFVFAEVNADCIDWLVKADGSLVNISTDTKRVGQNISTKSVGSNKRLNITDNYKHTEGSEEERAVFKYACTRDYSRVDKNEDIGETVGNVGPGESVGNVGTGETVGNVGPGESVGNVGTGETNRNVGTGETNRNVGTGETNRNVGTGESVGNVGTGETVGNVGTGETNRNVGTGESVGNVGTGESVGNVGTGVSETTNATIPPPPQVFLRFEEVSKPTNGKDVELKLVLHSENTVVRPLSINISAQAMTYNGIPAVNIQSEMKEEKLEPRKDLSIPIVVPFSSYHKHMVDCDSMKISAIVTDVENAKTYLAVSDVVLLHPPISVSVLTKDIRAFREVTGQVVFMNPAKDTLKNCKLTLSGSGLWKEQNVHLLPDMKQNNRITVTFYFIPYKTGEKTLMVVFDCATFRNIKCSCTVNVRP